MKLSKFIIVSMLISIASLAYGQYKSNAALKIGVNYVFTGKKSDFKSGLDIKTGLIFKTIDYVYIGPQLSINKLWNRGDKGGFSFVEIAPLLEFDLMRLMYEKVLEPNNKDYEKSDLVFNMAFGFNLDKNTTSGKAFQLTRFSFGGDFFSQEVLNSGLFLNFEGSTHFQREKIKGSFGLGPGAAIGF